MYNNYIEFKIAATQVHAAGLNKACNNASKMTHNNVEFQYN